MVSIYSVVDGKKKFLYRALSAKSAFLWVLEDHGMFDWMWSELLHIHGFMNRFQDTVEYYKLHPVEFFERAKQIGEKTHRPYLMIDFDFPEKLRHLDAMSVINDKLKVWDGEIKDCID